MNDMRKLMELVEDQPDNKKLKEAVYGFREQAFILGYQDGHADAKSGYNDAEAALNLWQKNRKV